MLGREANLCAEKMFWWLFSEVMKHNKFMEFGDNSE